MKQDEGIVKEGKEEKKVQRVIVFDSDTWRKTGDIGDNSQFYKEAVVICERWHEAKLYGSSAMVVDVMFPDGRISKGHFQSGVKYL